MTIIGKKKLEKLEFLPGLLNAIGGVGILLAGIWNTRPVSQIFPLNKAWVKATGIILVVIGISLVVWAATHIRKSFLGEIRPVLNHVVKTGPYRFIRHPVYLGMIIALLGLALTFDSLISILLTLLFFVPTVVLRAMLEEKVLAKTFGKKWAKYTDSTGFVFPSWSKKQS